MTQATLKPETDQSRDDVQSPTTDSTMDSQEHAMFEEFDLDDIEIIESKVFA